MYMLRTFDHLKQEFEVWGMDGSTYQDSPYIEGTPDFKKFVAEGGKFVILRLIFGKYKDVDFDKLSANVRNTTAKLGAYIFPDHRYLSTVNTQVEEVIKNLSGLKLDMPVQIDIENLLVNGASTFPSRAQAIAFYQPFYAAIKRITGHPAGTYLNPNAIKLLSPLPEFMLEGDLWIAHWKRSEPDVYAWEDYTFWQVDVMPVGGRLGMESKSLDINVFNGTPEEFEAYCAEYSGEQQGNEPPVIDEDLKIQVTANTAAIENNTVTLDILSRQFNALVSIMKENFAETAKDIDTI